MPYSTGCPLLLILAMFLLQPIVSFDIYVITNVNVSGNGPRIHPAMTHPFHHWMMQNPNQIAQAISQVKLNHHHQASPLQQQQHEQQIQQTTTPESSSSWLKKEWLQKSMKILKHWNPLTWLMNSGLPVGTQPINSGYVYQRGSTFISNWLGNE